MNELDEIQMDELDKDFTYQLEECRQYYAESIKLLRICQKNLRHGSDNSIQILRDNIQHHIDNKSNVIINNIIK